MSMEIVKVGKRNALYLPKSIVDELGIREGDRVQLSAENGRLKVELVPNPLRLALEGKKFARILPEEIESISLREQRAYDGHSS